MKNVLLMLLLCLCGMLWCHPLDDYLGGALIELTFTDGTVKQVYVHDMPIPCGEAGVDENIRYTIEPGFDLLHPFFLHIEEAEWDKGVGKIQYSTGRHILYRLNGVAREDEVFYADPADIAKATFVKWAYMEALGSLYIVNDREFEILSSDSTKLREVYYEGGIATDDWLVTNNPAISQSFLELLVSLDTSSYGRKYDPFAPIHEYEAIVNRYEMGGATRDSLVYALTRLQAFYKQLKKDVHLSSLPDGDLKRGFSDAFRQVDARCSEIIRLSRLIDDDTVPITPESIASIDSTAVSAGMWKQFKDFANPSWNRWTFRRVYVGIPSLRLFPDHDRYDEEWGLLYKKALNDAGIVHICLPWD